MERKRRVLNLFPCQLVALLSILLFNQCYAYDNQFELGTRPLGMGGAFVAVADDINASAWNPAGLAILQRRELNTFYANLFNLNIHQGLIAFGYPTRRFGTFGGNFVYIDYGKFQQRGEDKSIGVEFGKSDRCLNLSYGNSFIKLPSLHYGGNLKLMHIDMQPIDTAFGASIDMGLLYRLDEYFSFGLNIQDPFDARVSGGRLVARRNVKWGAAFHNRRAGNLVVGIDIDSNSSSWIDKLRLGSEIWLFRIIGLRVGIKKQLQEGNPLSFAAGASIRQRNFQIDYAISPHPRLGLTHRVSLNLSWGRPVEAEDLYKKGMVSYSAFLTTSKMEYLSQAIQDFRSAQEIFPEDREINEVLEKALAEKTRLEGEERQKRLKKSEEHLQKGLESLNKGEFDLAREELRKALELNPQNTEANKYLENINAIMRDTEPPEIMLSTQKVLITPRASITVEFYVVDNVGLKEIAVNDKTEQVFFEKGVAISKDIDLTPGLNLIKIRCVDLNINVSTETLKISFDGEPPVITILEPATKRVVVSEERITLRAKVEDNLGLDSIRVAGEEVEDVSGKTRVDIEGTLSLAQGENLIGISAKDSAGNITEDQISVVCELPKMNIAVAEFVGMNISEMDARVVAQFLRGDLVKSGAFRVIDRRNMEQILAEQGFQMTGCTEQECAVEIGHLLNVKKIIVGTFSHLLDRYYIDINLVDVETGEIIYSDRESATSTAGLEYAAERLAEKLVARYGKE